MSVVRPHLISAGCGTQGRSGDAKMILIAVTAILTLVTTSIADIVNYEFAAFPTRGADDDLQRFITVRSTDTCSENTPNDVLTTTSSVQI